MECESWEGRKGERMGGRGRGKEAREKEAREKEGREKETMGNGGKVRRGRRS